jgi:hypothetical protein
MPSQPQHVGHPSQKPRTPVQLEVVQTTGRKHHTWNPNSVFSKPFCVLLFAHPYELLRRLYEHMMDPVPALTAS